MRSRARRRWPTWSTVLTTATLPTYHRPPAPLAQWQSNGLLIRRFRVRIPGGALNLPVSPRLLTVVEVQDFEAFLLAHYEPVRRALALALGDPERAEDV